MERYADEELLYLIRCHQEDAQLCLFERYRLYIKNWILNYQKFFELGIDYDDCMQVAMIHFTRVLDCYRDDRKASLKTFMKFAILRRVSSYVISQKRFTTCHVEGFSLDQDVKVDDDFQYHEVIEDKRIQYQPDKIFMVKDCTHYYQTKIKEVSTALEMQVMDLKIQNYSNQEIAEILNIPIKSVYNAVYRIHKRMEVIDDYE